MIWTPGAALTARLVNNPTAPHAVLLGGAALLQAPWLPTLPEDGSTLLWQFLFALLGILTGWLAVRQLRERRRLREVEAKADQAKAESAQQSQQLAAINVLAAAMTRMSEAQIARAEAQDRERAAQDSERMTWRETIEAQGAQIAAMITGGLQMSDAVNHQAQAIDSLRAGVQQGTAAAVEAVNTHVDAGLGDVKEALATIWDTLEGLSTKLDSRTAAQPEVAAAVHEMLEVVRAIQSRIQLAPAPADPVEAAPALAAVSEGEAADG